MDRPYTTAELLELLRKHKGIKAHHQYPFTVILKSRNHPLKAAHLARGMWDKQIVDQYFKSPSK